MDISSISVFDAHSDIWTGVIQLADKGETDIFCKYHLEQLAKGRIEGAILVVWIEKQYEDQPGLRTRQLLEIIKRELELCRDDLVLARSYQEMKKAAERGCFYMLLGLEGLAAVGKDLEAIDQLYDQGARHASLTWNEENALATGIAGDPSRGLTDLGKQAVKKLQDKKMLLDVSHLNEASFWDVMRTANRPVAASHSSCRALCEARRNLTDEQLRAVRDMNGVVGINAFHGFISDDPEKKNLDSFLRHVAHAADLIGVEHVGFGFDFFDFIEDYETCSGSSQKTLPIQGLEDCSKAPDLLLRMRDYGFSVEEIEMIARGNFHRLIRETVG